jgi:anti-sigma regulatory factor (Ser/Thr protein kinase)
MKAHLLPDVGLAHLELAAALQQSSLAAATRHSSSAAARATSAGCFADGSLGSSRIFAGTRDQVCMVRRFARAELDNHPAVDEAVLVASELATNAITHSASGHHGGMFMVHLTAISADQVAILVTDQGGLGEPRAQHAGPDAESGRGLDVVTSIASLFIAFGDDTARTILAVVSPNGGRSTPPAAGRRAQAGEMAPSRSGLDQMTAPSSQRTFPPEVEALLVTAAMEIGVHGGEAGWCAACGSAWAGAGQPGLPVRAYCWEFPGTVDQVRRARSAVAAALEDCPLADDAVLCGSELATNAIRHSASGWPGGTFTVRAEIRPGRSVHLEVQDQGGLWQPDQDGDGRVHGLGIVAELAAGFSVHTPAAGGRIVRACLSWPAGTGGQR